ncbi:Serine protease precursor MucD/AlgY associated with sigma factor RpoE [hydrothermal vent metagenome]|uniref:Serine protease MucD/AlgY associated with sigma factor RpoE n=1 Tax=hydrothermal vent metagenome TaxID=652676 RepID=A0A3B0STS1_9ZZZZ
MKLARFLIVFLTLLALLPLQAKLLLAADRKVPSSGVEVQLSYAPVVRQAAPAVVNIYTKRVVKTRSFSPFANDPFFQRFFGDRFGGTPRERIERSLGSGVIVGADGVIVTNHHVVGGADKITVALSDRREFDAEVILNDEKTDLAVLRIDTGGEKLPTLTFSDSDNIQVGDLVLAIGNPFGVGQTVTSGIVSALARTQVSGQDYQFFIQTDAAVNPGNSGGALVGMDGELIGINTAIFSRSGGSNGIGFAIPANMVKYVVSSAVSDGRLVRPWFGGGGQAVTSDIAESLGFDRPGGVLVDDVYPGGPADRAGLKQGDVILRIDGKEVSSPEALRYYTGLEPVGGVIPLEILRGEKHYVLQVPLMAAPEDPPRNITTLKGNHLFSGIRLANLSPAYAQEIGVSVYEKGVIVLDVPRSVMRRTSVRRGDIFKAVNGKKLGSIREIKTALDDNPFNMDFTVSRAGRIIDCVIRAEGRSYCQ